MMQREAGLTRGTEHSRLLASLQSSLKFGPRFGLVTTRRSKVTALLSCSVGRVSLCGRERDVEDDAREEDVDEFSEGPDPDGGEAADCVGGS